MYCWMYEKGEIKEEEARGQFFCVIFIQRAVNYENFPIYVKIYSQK